MPSEAVSLSVDDLPLMVEVLERNSSMYLAVHAVKVIEHALNYPIADVTSVTTAFADRSFVQVHTSRITREQVEQFLPASCFPIPNRRLLISRLIMAFERERMTVVARLAQAQGHQLAWKVTDV